MPWTTRGQLSGKRRVFNLLRRASASGEPISRACLAHECSLTRPAVSAIIDEMASEGLVSEVGRGSSTGGKPPIMLRLTDDSKTAIGIDLGDDFTIRGALCGMTGSVLYSVEKEYENKFENIVEVISALVSELAAQADEKRFSGVGIAVSGVVNQELDEVACSSTLDIVGKGLAAAVSRRTGFPALLEKRPNAAALAESLFGAGREYRNLVYITSGRGVGAGIVINGEVYRGHSGTAGEIGQLMLPNGRKLEEWTRPSAMALEYSGLKRRDMNFAAFREAYFSGEPDAVELVMKNASHMAYAAGTAAEFFDPEIVVLGGPILEFGKKYFERFALEFAKVKKNRLCAMSCFGGVGVAVGGAQVVLDRLIK